MKEHNEEKLNKQASIRRSRGENLVLRKASGILPEGALQGEVISIIGNSIVVEASVGGEILQINCVNSGTIISQSRYSNLLATGDNVLFTYNCNSLSKIVSVLPRKTKFSRVWPSNRNKEQVIAANIDTVIIFVSTFDPMLNTRLIDRYLVAAKISNIKPIICVNKIELCQKSFIYKLMSSYKKLGVSIFYISALEGIGMERIKKHTINKKSVISGVSGAGKSTFLNALLGYSAQVVREISERTSKGTHTTSFSKRYNLSSKGFVIDTPGLREFGIWDLSKEEIGVVFPDFEQYFPKCKFTSCTHTSEPGCAVRAAVESGELDEERYLSYLNIYESLE